MNVSSVKNLNGETFSAVQDAYLTVVVSNNSANWNEISAYQANSGNYQLTADMTAYANSADVTGTAQYGLTTAGWTEITGGSVVPEGVMVGSGLEYDVSGNISAYSGSAFAAQLPEEEEVEFEEINISSISAATDYVTATSANIDSTIDNVSANSGAWGGSALPISAGPGIKVNLVNNTLVFSNDETVLWSGSGNGDTTYNLSESMSNFNTVKILYNPWTDNTQTHFYEFDYNKVPSLDQPIYTDMNLYTSGVMRLMSVGFSAVSDSQMIVNGIIYFDGSFNGQALNKANVKVYEIRGINRIAGGN